MYKVFFVSYLNNFFLVISYSQGNKKVLIKDISKYHFTEENKKILREIYLLKMGLRWMRILFSEYRPGGRLVNKGRVCCRLTHSI